MDLGAIFLYLHIGGAIVAFGPTIAFPFIAAKAQKEPMHGNFALRIMEFVTERVVEPGAVFVFVTGVALIISRGYNPLTTLWVALAIVVFIVVFAFATLVQLRTLRRMVALTSGPPSAANQAAGSEDVPAPSGSRMPAPAIAGAGPAGPPPQFLALAARADRGGKFMTLGLFILLALMVFKPTL